MEKIILSELQVKLYLNYEEGVIAFFKKKFFKRGIIFKIIFYPIFLTAIFVGVFAPFVIFFSPLFHPNVTKIFIVILSTASYLFSSFFVDNIKNKLEYKLRKSFSSFFTFSSALSYYEVNFVDCSSFVCSIKKEELQNIFEEEVKKEIERFNSMLEAEKTVYDKEKVKLAKKELEDILSKLEK